MDSRTDSRPIAAIASPSRCGPVFVPSNYDFDGAWPERPRSIRDDALIFIDLLSLTHGVGLQTTGYTYTDVERKIERLLGRDISHRPSTMSERGGRSSIRMPSKPGVSVDKLSEAVQVLSKMRKSTSGLRLALSRIASSLSRSGPLAELDSIVDIAISLEAMYRVGPPEQRYRLAMRASCFLEDRPENRKAIHQTVRNFYKARSAIVHGGTGDIKSVLVSGREIASRTLTKLALEGGPSKFEDWDDLVISG